ncbi:MAG: hypothetical protein HYV97_01305 [Bdellovibrio sp.]|nr:hypothetical protein [Bdellovibrio sp.]
MRWYDSITGRFISPDPIGFSGRDTNLYRYTFDEPLGRVDSDGLDSYRTNMGHGFLVIDDPKRSGGVCVFTFGPRDPSVVTYAKTLALQPVAASAAVDFFPKGSDLTFLGIEGPILSHSSIIQTATSAQNLYSEDQWKASSAGDSLG